MQKMRWRLILTIVLLGIGFWQIYPSNAQDQRAIEEINEFFANTTTTAVPMPDLPPDEYYRGQVLRTQQQLTPTVDGDKISPILHVRLLNGPNRGLELEFDQDHIFLTGPARDLQPNDRIVVAKNYTIDGERFYIVDYYRLPNLAWLGAIFLAVVIWFGRGHGVRSLIGLGMSIAILSLYIVPGILKGNDPVTTVMIGGIGISVLSLYIGHGIHKRTTVAVLSTLATLILATIAAKLSVVAVRLFGFGSENAVFLQYAPDGAINAQGLLLGGMIIGVLGVLDDITTAQSAAVDELKKASPSLSQAQLYRHAISIGKEHIASLVNTLVLAYAGSSLSLFVLFAMNNTQPLWLTLNSEFAAEEIVRTLIGSAALILAVPITTGLAAWVFTRFGPDSSLHTHGHPHSH